MTSDADQDHEHLFLADIDPELGEYLAGQCAAGYDADAGRARFGAWLLAQAEPADGQETRAEAEQTPVRPRVPRPPLDYSYQQQVEMLAMVRRGVADVAASRRRVERRMDRLTEETLACDDEAREALGFAREDLARAALQRKASLQTELNDLQTEHVSLLEQEEKLTSAAQRLQEKVEAFRVRAEATVTWKPTAPRPGPDADADPVTDYLNKVRDIRPLDASQEVELARRIKAGLAAEGTLTEGTGLNAEQRADLERLADDGRLAKNRLLEANLRLVVALANRLADRGVTFLDLVQAGNVGLVRAVEKFDPARGYQFSAYATWWIRQTITRAVADRIRTTQADIAAHEIIELQLFMREPTDPGDEDHRG